MQLENLSKRTDAIEDYLAEKIVEIEKQYAKVTEDKKREILVSLDLWLRDSTLETSMIKDIVNEITFVLQNREKMLTKLRTETNLIEYYEDILSKLRTGLSEKLINLKNINLESDTIRRKIEMLL